MKKYFRQRRQGFTLIEIMIVVAIIGIILAIAIYTWQIQRNLSQARCCQENLTKIDGAKDEWALEMNQPGNATVNMSDLYSNDGTGILKFEPVCPAGGTYDIGLLGVYPTCTILTPINHNPSYWANPASGGSGDSGGAD